MALGLSYPGLRSVLEYLDPARRIYITARSPALRPIEKSIPIYFRKLKMEECDFEFDNLEVSLQDKKQIFINVKEDTYKNRYPRELGEDEAMGMINDYYLRGRTNILVDRVTFYSKPLGSLNFILKTNKLILNGCTLDEIHPNLHPSSFPLNNLKMTIDCVEDRIHPVVCSAMNLIIEISAEEYPEDLNNVYKIQYKKVEFEYEDLEMLDVGKFISYWIENGMDIGTTFFFSDVESHLDEILTQLKKNYKQFQSKLKGIIDYFLARKPRFSIPLGSTSKILVYGRKSLKYADTQDLVLRVVSSHDSSCKRKELQYQIHQTSPSLPSEMAFKLCYPGLRCVLEYLDPARRIYITARNPDLRIVEKSIPIYFRKLEMEETDFEFNNTTISINEEKEIAIIYKRNSYKHTYPRELENDEAMGKIIDHYLGGRMNILVDRVAFYGYPLGSLNFILNPNKLILRGCTLDEIYPNLHPSSFPLKKLAMIIDCIENPYYPFDCYVENLIIEVAEEDHLEDLTNVYEIQHKKVEFEYEDLEMLKVEKFINCWMENGMETGTIFSFFNVGDHLDEILSQVMKNYEQFQCGLEGTDDSFISGKPSFSIPLGLTTKILVYGRESLKYADIQDLILEVVSSHDNGAKKRKLQ